MKLRVCFAALLMFLPSMYGRAQDSRATIVGSVTDASGAAVMGATVTAMNIATNVKTTAQVNGAGIYQIPYLDPGVYDVTVEASQFKTFVRRALELRISDVAKLDVSLQPGEVTQTITVTGATSLLQAESASIDTTIDKKTLVDAPISGGDALTLALVSPGTTDLAIANHPYELTSAAVASRMSVSGMRSQNTQFMTDGSPSMSGDSAVYVPPVDLIQETQTETNSYSAAYGHSVGGYVNTVTRSGTNQLHGSAYEFHTDASLEGLNIFQRNQLDDLATGPITSAKLKSIKGGAVSNRYGGSIGGPVVIPHLYNGRDKTFWIAGYEGFRNPNTDANSGSYFTVPTAAERNGDFSALLALGPAYQIYNPATTTSAGNGTYSRQPFPGNIIPPSKIDATAKLYLNYYPLPNSSATVTPTGLNNYFAPVRGLSNYDLMTVRVDHVLRGNDRIFGRFNYGHLSGGDLNSFDNAATNYFNRGATTGAAIDYVHVFSPSLLMDLHYGFMRYAPSSYMPPVSLSSLNLPSSLISQIPSQSQVFPKITIDGGAYTILGNDDPTDGPTTNYHTLLVDITKSFGRHTVAVGGDFRVYEANDYTLANSRPYLTFGSTYTNGPLNTAPAAAVGQGLASFLLGIPTGGTMVVNTSYAMASKYYAGYMQDDFKVTSRFTLNWGFRYEYETPPVERHNRIVQGFNASVPSPIAAAAMSSYAQNPIPQVPASQFAVNGGLTFAGVNGDQRGIWATDRHNIAPRVGAAFQIDAKTVVRGGYGVFYMPKGVDYIGSAYDRYAINQLGFSNVSSVVPSTNNGVTFSASLANPFPNGLVQPLGAAGGLSTGLGTSISFYNPKQVNPFVQRWSFGFQRELPAKFLVEAVYDGTLGRDLQINQNIDTVPAQYLSTTGTRNQTVINTLSAIVANPFAGLIPGQSLNNATVATSQLLLPYPQFTGVTYNNHLGRSIYHAAWVRVERRFAEGFSFQGNYTFSKFMQSDEYLNASDPTPTHVISDQDIPEKFEFAGIYDIPVGKGRRFGSNLNSIVAGIVGGWQVSMIWQGQSGTPLGFGDPVFTGTNYHNITLPNNEKTIDKWFNVNQFDRNAADALADNIQTFPLRLPEVRTNGVSNVNDSVMKYFPIKGWEGARFQIRCEMMNAFNRSQLAAPNTTPTSSLFGQTSSVQSVARQIFFAGKIIF